MRVLLPWSGRRTNNSDCESCGNNNEDDHFVVYEEEHDETLVDSESEEGKFLSSRSDPSIASSESLVLESGAENETSGSVSSSHNHSSCSPSEDETPEDPHKTSVLSPRASKRRAEDVRPSFTPSAEQANSTKRLRPDSKPAAQPDMAVGGPRRKVEEGDDDEDVEPSYIVTNYWQQPSENQPPPALPNDPLRGVAAMPEAALAAAAEEESSLERFRQALKQRGLDMVEQDGDGNCLFRAVSLQVYGQADNHAQVREQCLNFMASSEEHYSNFVAGEALSFQDYLTLKRRDGVHGNHAEIQAISELFNRPIEVYKSPESGDGPIEPINIFHAEYKTSDPPIRLSYHNNNHYNAVVDPLVPTAGLGLGLPGLKPGLADKMQVTQAKAESDILADEMELERILKESKEEQKEKEDDQLQRILKESTVDFVRHTIQTGRFTQPPTLFQMYKHKAMALSDLDATNLELEQKALAFSMEEQRGDHGRKRRAERRRRPSPVMDQQEPSTMFASVPTSAAASLPAAAAAARQPPSPIFGASGSSHVNASGEYPQAVEDLVMNGFELSKVLRAFDLVGDNFDDLLSFLLTNSS